MRASRACFLAVLLCVVGLVGCDHATKLAAETALRDHAAVQVVPGVVDLAYTENHGVAFSALERLSLRPPAWALFALAAIPALLSLVVLAARVRDVGRGAPPAKEKFSGFRGLGRRFYIFLAIVLVFTLGNATDAFLLLRAQQLGVPLALIPILWSAFHVSKMIWNIIGGRLADRLGPRPAIISAITRALPDASVKPSAPWPVLSQRLLYGVLPISGFESGVAGRWPHHVCALA